MNNLHESTLNTQIDRKSPKDHATSGFLKKATLKKSNNLQIKITIHTFLMIFSTEIIRSSNKY
jgi:hypothetical protein